MIPVDLALCLGDRGSHRHGDVSRGDERPDTVFDTIDLGVGVARFQQRKLGVGRDGFGEAGHAGGEHQAIGGVELLVGADHRIQQIRHGAEAGHRIKAPIQLAVLVFLDAQPYPGAQRHHQHHHAQRGDGDQGAQREDPHGLLQ
ncbi:Uncharacterised protein [Mycobacteroides abscessus subsp. massiliense]|nr:Uncharacterised protein [Mycobacteroides abscessus subsp. massiliense]